MAFIIGGGITIGTGISFIDGSAAPAANDPYFEYVTTLLPGSGTNNAANNTFVDSSTNNFSITRFGNTTQGSLGPYGGGWSNYFDGNGDYLSAPVSTAYNFTGDFTIEAWVYPTVINANNAIAAQWVSGNLSFLFKIVSGSRLYITCFPGSAVVVQATSTTVNLNQWNHVAVTRSGTTVKLFVNGVQDTTTGTVSGSLTSGTPLTIGSVATAEYFTGYISNLRIIKGTAVYTANFAPPTQPLTAIANTSLLTCADNRFIDDSANNFVITRAGDVSVDKFNPYGLVTQTPTTYSGYFDGTGDYLNFTGTSATQFGSGDFTIECWIYTGTTSAGTIYGDRTGANFSGMVFCVNNYYISLLMSTQASTWNINTYSATTGTQISPNTWTHVALVRSGTNVNVYTNGTLNYTRTLSGTLTQSSTARIGGEAGDTPALNGYISNFRMVKGTAVYTANFTPPTQPLTAIANTGLLTCQSPTFVDNSTNNFAITVNGNSRPTTVNPFGFTFVNSTEYTPAVYGGSMYFDGTGDYLTGTISAPSTGQFTVEAWVYITNRSAARCVFTSRSGNTTDGFQLVVDSGGEVRVGYTGTNFINSAANTVVAEQWYHLAVTRNSANLMTLWINGISAGTSTITNNFNNAAIRVGLTAENGSPMFGYVSNLRFVNGSPLYTSSFTPPTQPLTAVANTSLLLNGTNAAIYDASISNDFETVGDAKISTAVSKWGAGSMSFDGTGDYLVSFESLSSTFNTGNYTIESWIYRSDSGTQRAIVDTRGASTVGLLFYITSNNKLNVFDSTSTYITSTNTVPSGQWVHVAVTRDSGTTRLFINGIVEATLSNDTRNNVTGAGGLYVGRQFGSTSNDFNGYMQDLRITKGVARYTANFTPPTAALPLY